MTLTLIALLPFYDEPSAGLAALVESLRHVADALIAYDGAWALYPDPRTTSPADNWEALADTAADGELELTIHAPARPWTTETAKRHALVRHGVASGADFLLLVDGDETIERRGARLELELQAIRTHATVAHSQGAPSLRLFRNHPELSVRGPHNGYAHTRHDEPWPQQRLLEANADNLTDVLAITHHRERRTRERLEAMEIYRNRLAETGGEPLILA
jgi:hypothetical protein